MVPNDLCICYHLVLFITFLHSHLWMTNPVKQLGSSSTRTVPLDVRNSFCLWVAVFLYLFSYYFCFILGIQNYSFISLKASGQKSIRFWRSRFTEVDGYSRSNGTIGHYLEEELNSISHYICEDMLWQEKKGV